MNDLPVIGFGTWVDSQGGQQLNDIVDQVQQAYAIGYRHFDTAANYGTEKLVQQALMTLIVDSYTDARSGQGVTELRRNSGSEATVRTPMERSSFFVTTKYGSGHVPTPSEMYRYHLVGGVPIEDIPPQDRNLGHSSGVPGVISGFQLVPEDTPQVDFGYFDLILLHNPPLTADQNRFELQLLDDWNRLITLQKAGYAKRIGVSNFYARQLGILLDLCRINGLPLPYVNQIEFHPWCQMPDLVAQCQGYGIMVVAHTPLGGLASGYILQRPELDQIASRLTQQLGHDVTPAQVVLAFALRQGIVVIPKSTQPARMEENLGAVGIVNALTEDDLTLIRSMDIGQPLIELSQTAWLLDQQLQ